MLQIKQDISIREKDISTKSFAFEVKSGAGD